MYSAWKTADSHPIPPAVVSSAAAAPVVMGAYVSHSIWVLALSSA